MIAERRCCFWCPPTIIPTPCSQLALFRLGHGWLFRSYSPRAADRDCRPRYLWAARIAQRMPKPEAVRVRRTERVRSLPESRVRAAPVQPMKRILTLRKGATPTRPARSLLHRRLRLPRTRRSQSQRRPSLRAPQRNRATTRAGMHRPAVSSIAALAGMSSDLCASNSARRSSQRSRRRSLVAWSRTIGARAASRSKNASRAGSSRLVCQLPIARSARSRSSAAIRPAKVRGRTWITARVASRRSSPRPARRWLSVCKTTATSRPVS